METGAAKEIGRIPEFFASKIVYRRRSHLWSMRGMAVFGDL